MNDGNLSSLDLSDKKFTMNTCDNMKELCSISSTVKNLCRNTCMVDNCYTPGGQTACQINGCYGRGMCTLRGFCKNCIQNYTGTFCEIDMNKLNQTLRN